jgi:hypothetical protein
VDLCFGSRLKKEIFTKSIIIFNYWTKTQRFKYKLINILIENLVKKDVTILLRLINL